MRYPGGKGAAGCREQIIGMMPPHSRYIEPYFGGGAVFYAKKPAASSIVSDVDPDLMRYHQRDPVPSTIYRTGDAIELLGTLELTGTDLVYCDPPYMAETRRSLDLYHHETDDAHHRALLIVLKSLPCMVIVSGYRCPLYDTELSSWHRRDWRTMSRGGVRTESAWCNFTPGQLFHDTRFAGEGFREREKIKRKRDRWVSRFKAMRSGERAVIAEALQLAGLAVAVEASSKMALRDLHVETNDEAGSLAAAGGGIASPNMACPAGDLAPPPTASRSRNAVFGGAAG